MRIENLAYVPTQVASAFVHIESYTRDTHLIVSKAEGESTFIGRAYEMSPLTGGGSEFSGMIQNIFKMAPDNSLIQVTLICSPDHQTPYVMARGKTHGNELLQELINRQAQVYQKALDVGGLDDIPTINMKTVVISFMTPVSTVSEPALMSAADTQNEFLAGLRSCGFTDARVVPPATLLGIYRQFANIYAPRKDAAIDELLDLRLQAFGPDDHFDFRASEYGILNKTTFCAAVVPKSLPSVVSNGLMNLIVGAPLNTGSTKEGGGLRCKTPFILSATVRVAHQRKETERVSNAIRSRSREEKLPFTLGTEDREEILKDLQYLEATCGDGTNKFTYASLSAFVFARTREDLVAAKSGFKTTFNNLDFDAREVTDTTGVRFAQALPLNYSLKLADKLANEALMPASAAACLLPIFGDYLGNANTHGERTGTTFITRRGSAYNWDMFETNGNKNGVLSAASGVGKSFAMQYIINNELAQGTKVILFDNGQSAKKSCVAAGGEFIQFDIGSGNVPSLNPFTGLDQAEFDEQAETISALILKMAYYDEAIENGARIAVSEAVKSAYGQKQKRADIGTVIESLTTIMESSQASANKSEVQMAAINLVPRLKNFMNSPTKGPFFTGPATLDPKNKFTVFELSGLDGEEHLKQCVLFFVMNTLLRTIRAEPGRKLIMLDEAWELLRDEGSAPVMEGLYRKIRKERGSIWVITQSMRDLSGNATGEVILSQSVWKLVMEQEPEEVDKIVSQGVMTKFAHDAFFNKLIKDIKTKKRAYSEILICGEGGYEAVRLYVDRFTSALFSTDGDERDVVLKMMKDGINPIDAVNHVIGDTKYKRTKWLKEILAQLRNFDNLTDGEIKQELHEAMNE